MRSEHKNIQVWIAQWYHSKYVVSAEIREQNRLPDDKRHWYQPDVILRDNQGDIVFIIEVENDPVRKAIVGASVLADACIGAMRQRRKPIVIFVIYTKQGIRQIHNFNSKIKLVKPYCKHLKDIAVCSVQHFKQMKL